MTTESAVLLAGIYYVAAIILLARCSHWAYQSQIRTAETNQLLFALLQIHSQGGYGQQHPAPRPPGYVYGR